MILGLSIRIAVDPAFKLSDEELRANLDPAKYTGRSESQVDEFLKDFVQPVLDRIYEAPVESVLNV